MKDNSLLESLFVNNSEDLILESSFREEIDDIISDVDNIVLESILDTNITKYGYIATEGTTFQALKAYYGKEGRSIRKNMKTAKKLVKQQKYDEAIKLVKDVKTSISAMINKLEALEDTIPSTICSFLLNLTWPGMILSLSPMRYTKERTESIYREDFTETFAKKFKKSNCTKISIISFYRYCLKSCDYTILNLNKLRKGEKK